MRNVRAIPGEVQNALVKADIDKKKIKKAVKKACAERRKTCLLKDVNIWKRFEKVTKLVDVGALNWWGHFEYTVLKACDEACGKKRGRKSKGDTWWWNEEVKEAVLWKKDAHKAIHRNNTEKNKRRYKSMKNKAA